MTIHFDYEKTVLTVSQQFNHYNENEQSPLTSTRWTPQKGGTTTYDVENPGSKLDLHPPLLYDQTINNLHTFTEISFFNVFILKF